MSSLIRSFIALELSAGVKKALADLQEKLRERIPRARWTRPEGTHLTLKFLGEIEREKIEAVAAALDQIAAQHPPFKLKLEGLGAFPRLAFPRVIWVGLQHNDQLPLLQKTIETALEPLGFEPERRSFHGHLTLARLEGERWSEELRRYFLELSPISDGKNIPVKSAILFRSELKPGGAIYTALHRSPLIGS